MLEALSTGTDPVAAACVTPCVPKPDTVTPLEPTSELKQAVLADWHEV